MEDQPRISVALCTFNGARFLAEQLASISTQKLQPSEIVICDDASTDSTVEILKSFAAQSAIPVRLHCNTENVGVTANFDQAIRLCEGDFIALADQDDVWLPHKLGRLFEAFVTKPDTAFVFSDARLVNEHGHDLGGKSLLARRFVLTSIERAFREKRELDLMLKRDFIYGTTLMFRADARPLFQPIPSTWSHDTWIVNVLSFRGHPGVPVLEPLVQYRQHNVQASGGTAAPRSVSYADRVSAYDDMRTRLVSIDGLNRKCIVRIDEKLRYLRAMTAIQSAPPHVKVSLTAREVLSGRWWRYTPRTFLVDTRFEPAFWRR